MGKETWANDLIAAAEQVRELIHPCPLKKGPSVQSILTPVNHSAPPAYVRLVFEGLQLHDSEALIGWYDPHQVCTYMNPALCDFLGLPPDQPSHEEWILHLHPKDRTGVMKTFDVAFRLHRPFLMNYRKRHRDGHYGWIWSQWWPYWERDGSFAGYLRLALEAGEILSDEVNLAAAGTSPQL